MTHLDEHMLLRKRQSCETELTTVTKYWAKSSGKKGQVDTFLLDFEKAFESIHSPELLKVNFAAMGYVEKR